MCIRDRDIRVQVKLLNNYPKYFQITTCKDNEVSFYHTKETMYEYDRIFENPPYPYQISTTSPKDTYQINFGHRSAYGMCFCLLYTSPSPRDRG
eukprot:TRINITY_DN9065_c0_g1_i1.p1 TRINITY_DN9065_c0_g1~~TRINITY_DN9065_c0_g1_i1.p1  ORF type:complete len:101 (+),score=21.99 TRINITY_DN9065_c0_g1_i1:23-304(+)